MPEGEISRNDVGQWVSITYISCGDSGLYDIFAQKCHQASINSLKGIKGGVMETSWLEEATKKRNKIHDSYKGWLLYGAEETKKGRILRNQQTRPGLGYYGVGKVCQFNFSVYLLYV